MKAIMKLAMAGTLVSMLGACSSVTTIAERETYTPNWAPQIAEHNLEVAEQLKLAKKAGMTCAIRTGNNSLDYIMCRDEVGSFRLKKVDK